MKKKVVITYGTFDLFHYGHLKLLERAKNISDELIVGVSTDKFNLVKNKKCIFKHAHRAEIVNSIKYVDKVIKETDWKQKEADIIKYNVDTLVMGGDWKGKFDHLKKYCEVIYFPRTKDISSTKIKLTINNVGLVEDLD